MKHFFVRKEVAAVQFAVSHYTSGYEQSSGRGHGLEQCQLLLGHVSGVENLSLAHAPMLNVAAKVNEDKLCIVGQRRRESLMWLT